MKWIVRIVIGIVAFIAIVIFAGCAYQTISEWNEARAYPPPGQMIDVSGYKLHLYCMGEGTPTVILDAAFPAQVSNWVWVQPQIAKTTRVCAYDRPATVGPAEERSRSDPTPEPVTAADGVADLAALLAAADVRGPYVLVGHSYGGLIARLHASTYPDVVAGVVLEDALSEGLYAGLTAQQQAILEKINEVPERVDTVRSFAQVTSAPPVRPQPMVILTADTPPIGAEDVASGALPGVTPEFVDALWVAQVAAQNALAALFPWARHVTDTRSRHYIHVEQPQLVVAAIRDVVDAVRGAGR